jgi:SEL1 protein
MRRDEGQAAQPGQNGAGGAENGVFPPPGDPARQDWAVMR